MPVYLAFDLATKMGWAVGQTTSPTEWRVVGSGTKAFPTGRLIGPGRRGRQVQIWMRELVHHYKPAGVFFEKVAGAPDKNGIAALQLYGLFQGLLQMACSEVDVVPQPLHIGTIKKHATGQGNAKKPDMIRAAMKRWPEIKIEDDNHADALWILDLGLSHKPQQLTLITK